MSFTELVKAHNALKRATINFIFGKGIYRRKRKSLLYRATEREVVAQLSRDNLFVRRFTPTECGRSQGMPDWWCSDIEHSDAAEYKMWGNGMALPNILYVVENVVRVLRERYEQYL